MSRLACKIVGKLVREGTIYVDGLDSNLLRVDQTQIALTEEETNYIRSLEQSLNYGDGPNSEQLRKRAANADS